MQKALQPKVTVEKKPKRAGATPLFRLSAAQKVRGVAPARLKCAPEGTLPCASALAAAQSAPKLIGIHRPRSGPPFLNYFRLQATHFPFPALIR